MSNELPSDPAAGVDGAREVEPRIVGRKQTPRGLIITTDDQLARDLDDLFPHCERVDYVGNVREQEYDVVVSTEEFTGNVVPGLRKEMPAPHLFLITFGVRDLGLVPLRPGEDGAPRAHGLRFTYGALSGEFMVPDVPPLFHELVVSDLLTAVQRRDGSHATLATDQLGLGVHKTITIPLLKTAAGEFLAGIYARKGPKGSGLGLALPDDVGDKKEWVKAALHFFRSKDPGRFQQIPGWEERHEWSTAEEQRIRVQIADVEADHERVLADLERRRRALKAELAEASAAADTGLRGLLTLRGDDLVPVVAEALERLGFDVRLVDQEADPSNKLEDLRVSDPSEEGVAEPWEALVEVRAYKGGAQLADLARVERFVRRYRDETGRWPPAVWYIVNQRAGIDPDVRQPVLSAQQIELEEWADNNAGLAIDTSDLFRLVVDVESSRLTAGQARQWVRIARARYEHPYAESTDG